MAVEAPAQISREVPVEEIPLGDLHIYPVLPGFEQPDPFSSSDTFERLQIPLSEGQAYVVTSGARPMIDSREGGRYFEIASAFGEAKDVLDDAKGEYADARGDLNEATQAHWGLVGVDIPQEGKTILSRPVYERQFTDPDRVIDELGSRVTEVGKPIFETSYDVPQGLTTKDGKPVTKALLDQIARAAFEAEGIEIDTPKGMRMDTRSVIEDIKWSEVKDALVEGRLSFVTVSAEPAQRAESLKYNPSRGAKSSKR